MIRFVAAAVFFAVAACGPTRDDLEALKEESRACVFGDPCVLAGANQCSCPSPVNERMRDRVDQLASEVECGGAMVECPTYSNVRCEDDRCVADSAP